MRLFLAFLLIIFFVSCASNNTEVEPYHGLESQSNVSISGNSTIRIGQNFEVYVLTDSVIRVPQATYYTKAGPWQIFKKQGNVWEEIEFFNNCFNSCDDVCTDPLQCVPGGPFPGCSRVRDGFTYLKWDLRELRDNTAQCGSEVLACKNSEFIDPGQYKVVFNYRDDCKAGVSWTIEESPIYKKEFLFEVLA